VREGAIERAMGLLCGINVSHVCRCNSTDSVVLIEGLPYSTPVVFFPATVRSL
jgi:hypothetical protein